VTTNTHIIVAWQHDFTIVCMSLCHSLCFRYFPVQLAFFFFFLTINIFNEIFTFVSGKT